MAKKFKVEIPTGYLMVEEKGTKEEYPGVYISFSKDGKEYDVSKIIACVEYDTGNKEIRTTTYTEDCGDPNYIIRHNDGENLI